MILINGCGGALHAPTIHNEPYLAHTDPLFKNAKVLKLPDIHTQAQLKFRSRRLLNELPDYLIKIPFDKNCDMHDYPTRHNEDFRDPRPATEYNRKVIRNSLPGIVNSLPAHLENILATNPQNIGYEYKKCILLSYSDACSEENCYSCELSYAFLMQRNTIHAI